MMYTGTCLHCNPRASVLAGKLVEANTSLVIKTVTKLVDVRKLVVPSLTLPC
jgi:hypothetical protein